MDKIKEFFKLITSDQYLGWILLGIFVLVIIVAICIVMHYLNKKKKAETEARKYRHNELANLSDEEVKNIANNVADPEVLYKKLEEHEQQVKAEIEAESGKKTTKKTSTNKKETKPSTAKKTETKKVESVETQETTQKPETKKTTSKKVESVETQESTSTPKKVSYNGKWKVKEEDGRFYAELYASNGVIVLKTEYYTSLNGVKNGIETIKKNVNVGNFATSVDKNGRYCFKLFSKSNRLICISDFYSSKAKCESGINSVKRFAETSTIITEEN